jgi:hypothetical protein
LGCLLLSLFSFFDLSLSPRTAEQETEFWGVSQADRSPQTKLKSKK